jgi:ABC-type multidrug transport system ATPase subunit
MELEIKKLNKVYGENHALQDFSYKFTEGVYGLLGPNGAGKSTLMNIVTDNLKESSGEVIFDGVDTKILGRDFRKILGYMPQQQGIYHHFTLNRFLYYMAALKGISKIEADKQIVQLIHLVNLDVSANQRLGSFSGGMRQRALIAQSLLGTPKVLILDEPTAGLDPKERIRIRNLIAKIAFNKIVILATHVVSDIEYIAKEVLFLNKGTIINSGSPHSLCDKMSHMVFEIIATQDKLSDIVKNYRIGNISKDEKNIYIRVTSPKPPLDYEYKEVKSNLEDVYLSYFDEDVMG